METALSNLRLESNTSKTAGKRNKESGKALLGFGVHGPIFSLITFL